MKRVLSNGEKRKQYVREMFNNIAPKYDLLNRLLSVGADNYWRRQAILKMNIPPDSLVLDIACGTGDFAFASNKLKNSKVYAIDIAPNMLSLAQQKAKKKSGNSEVIFLAGDGEDIPFSNESFDAVTIAFGIRNMGDIKQNLSEMYRILKPGGELIILEFSIPKSPFIRKMFQRYFFKILPRVGNKISKDPEAYRYLPESVEIFPPRREFVRWIEDENFSKIQYWRLFNGIAAIYKGVKIK